MKGYGVAYLITNVTNGRSYVGVTTRDDPSSRWGEHARKARTKSRQVLQRAIAAHGAAAFRFEVIASAVSSDALGGLERILIAQHGTLTRQGGYNCTPGGESGFRETGDAGARISAKARKRWSDPSYRARSTIAIAGAWTEESKARAAAKQADVWKDPAYRASRKQEDQAAKVARVRGDWADPVKRAARIEAIKIGKRKGGEEQRARLSAAVREGKRIARERRAVALSPAQSTLL